jgi:hypothetical protein
MLRVGKAGLEAALNDFNDGSFVNWKDKIKRTKEIKKEKKRKGDRTGRRERSKILPASAARASY